MTFDVTHFGLYFGQSDIDNAQSQREKQDDLQSAWQWLLAASGDLIKERKSKEKNGQPEQVIKADLTAASRLIEAAFRYRFADDAEAAQTAIHILEQGFGLSEQVTLFETICQTLTAAHTFEMLRDVMPNADGWLQQFAQFSDNLQQAYDDANTIEQLWLTTLKIVSGVVLDDATRFEAGIVQVHHVIDSDIHPEGFFKSLVEDAKEKEIAFREMVLACAALTLAAEAASQAGENLWQYENRDVSINTAITYLVYYYFYPDKWRWGEDDLTETQTGAIFGELGAWIEVSTRRVNPRGVELLLEDQRPFFNPYMGGLTTLSHFKTEKPKRFGLFG